MTSPETTPTSENTTKTLLTVAGDKLFESVPDFREEFGNVIVREKEIPSEIGMSIDMHWAGTDITYRIATSTIDQNGLRTQEAFKWSRDNKGNISGNFITIAVPNDNRVHIPLVEGYSSTYVPDNTPGLEQGEIEEIKAQRVIELVDVYIRGLEEIEQGKLAEERFRREARLVRNIADIALEGARFQRHLEFLVRDISRSKDAAGLADLSDDDIRRFISESNRWSNMKALYTEHLPFDNETFADIRKIIAEGLEEKQAE